MGTSRASELRHPERAAAWLRRRVVDECRRAALDKFVSADSAVGLADLGVRESAITGFAALTVAERAALVADAVEHLDRRDIATIVGVEGSRLDRLITQARQRYLAAVAIALGDQEPAGPTVDRVRALVERSLR
jgi:DNA-directed RNA polymerase specialized sigma24 family protein